MTSISTNSPSRYGFLVFVGLWHYVKSTLFFLRRQQRSVWRKMLATAAFVLRSGSVGGSLRTRLYSKPALLRSRPCGRLLSARSSGGRPWGTEVSVGEQTHWAALRHILNDKMTSDRLNFSPVYITGQRQRRELKFWILKWKFKDWSDF